MNIPTHHQQLDFAGASGLQRQPARPVQGQARVAPPLETDRAEQHARSLAV